MAEEKPGEDNKEAAPKKKIPLVLIGLSFQSVVMIVAAVLVMKGVLFTKGPDLSDAHLKERAIASIKDDQLQIQTLDLKDFTINLPAQHTLRTAIQLEVSDAETVKLIKKRLPAIKYKILNLLASSSVSKTGSFQGKLLLKDALRESINEELSSSGHITGVVREVFFTDFFLL